VTGLLIIWVILMSYFRPEFPQYGVLWATAAGLAGGAGAWLTRRREREDLLLIGPALAGATAFLLLVWLGEGMRAEIPLRQAGGWIAAQTASTHQELTRLAPGNAGSRQILDMWNQLQRWLGPLLIASMMLLWTATQWLAGRAARWVGGTIRERRAALILLRAGEATIFLLICAVFLWIVGILAGAEQAALYVAAPLLAVVVVAGFFEGLAVILFQVALRRTVGPAWLAQAMLIGAVALAALLPVESVLVCTLLGLMDAWFDFRRLQRIQDQIDAEP
jgi:hypothetical protein